MVRLTGREIRYISSRNNRFWSAENLALIHEMQLSDIKIGVWYATSATRDNGPIPPPPSCYTRNSH
jgi:hypothetical protein